MPQPSGALPALIGEVIRDQWHYNDNDNLFADTWKKLKFNARLKGGGLHQAKWNRHNGSRFIRHIITTRSHPISPAPQMLTRVSLP